MVIVTVNANYDDWVYYCLLGAGAIGYLIYRQYCNSFGDDNNE